MTTSSPMLHPQPMTVSSPIRARSPICANGPTLAHSLTKEMLLREGDMGFSDAIEAEAQAQTLLMSANDFKEAYQAFVGKREPKFKGS